jgi:hypothetical protein
MKQKVGAVKWSFRSIRYRRGAWCRGQQIHHQVLVSRRGAELAEEYGMIEFMVPRVTL